MNESVIKKVKMLLSDFFLAPKANCLGCASQLGAAKGLLCPDCYASLSPLYTTFSGVKSICNLCGREITGLRCRCGGRRENAYTAYCAYHFELPVSTLVKAFKYRGVTTLSEWMADEMILSMKGDNEFDVITYVPMHRMRKLKRGFNQSELLADMISRKMNIPCISLLERKRFTRKQANLSGAKRRENLINAFSARKENIKGKRVLLIDDVRTTGTTVVSCARVLTDSGAEKVSAATFACAR